MGFIKTVISLFLVFVMVYANYIFFSEIHGFDTISSSVMTGFALFLPFVPQILTLYVTAILWQWSLLYAVGFFVLSFFPILQIINYHSGYHVEDRPQHKRSHFRNIIEQLLMVLGFGLLINFVFFS